MKSENLEKIKLSIEFLAFSKFYYNGFNSVYKEISSIFDAKKLSDLLYTGILDGYYNDNKIDTNQDSLIHQITSDVEHTKNLKEQRLSKLNKILEASGVEGLINRKPSKDNFESLTPRNILLASGSKNIINFIDNIQSVSVAAKAGISKQVFVLGETIGHILKTTTNIVFNNPNDKESKENFDFYTEAAFTYYTMLYKALDIYTSEIMPSNSELIEVFVNGIFNGIHSSITNQIIDSKESLDEKELEEFANFLDENFKDVSSDVKKIYETTFKKIEKFDSQLQDNSLKKLLDSKPIKSKKAPNLEIRQILLKKCPEFIKEHDLITSSKSSIQTYLRQSVYNLGTNLGSFIANELSPPLVNQEIEQNLKKLSKQIKKIEELVKTNKLELNDDQKNLIKSFKWQLKDHQDDLQKYSINLDQNYLDEIKLDIKFAISESKILYKSLVTCSSNSIESLYNLNKMKKIIDELDTKYKIFDEKDSDMLNKNYKKLDRLFKNSDVSLNNDNQVSNEKELLLKTFEDILNKSNLKLEHLKTTEDSNLQKNLNQLKKNMSKFRGLSF